MTPDLPVTAPYAAALALLFLALRVRVIVLRRTGAIGFVSAYNPELERRVRVHANFAEYTPFALLLLAMAELRDAPAPWLHAGCALLLAGRLAHAIGLSRPATDNLGRILGMTGSQSAIVIGAGLLVLG